MTTACPLISAHELNELLHTSAALTLLIDCSFDLNNPQKGKQLYDHAHIPGAYFMDLDKDLCGFKTGSNGRHPLPDRQTLALHLESMGLTPSSQVIVYDQDESSFAAHAWWLLRWLGHPTVRVLDGGFAAWKRINAPVTNQVPSPFAAKENNFPATPQVPTVEAAEILLRLGSPTLHLIDARAPERYRGEIEPIDPVAGHIPGATNRFYKDNLNPDATFKPAKQLAQEWLHFLNGHTPQTIVHQCGSGVSACHNILAMVYAGFDLCALYPGSWSEWCADPKNPIAQA